MIALGGNALGSTATEQRACIDEATPSLVGLIAQGHEIIVSHGNGPQVGAISLAFEIASQHTDRVTPMDLAECTAMSQGYIGYHLQQGIAKELRRVGMPWHVASVVTQVEVAADDPAFAHPTKPIGGFYDEADARALMAGRPGLVMAEDSGRGWRTVVASPRPVDIVERDSILNLLDHEFIVVACGGGGIPVARDKAGELHGVPAVIDKDFASAKLAEVVGADVFFILTAVDRVAIGFGTPQQRDLEKLDLAEARRYLDDGQFGAGSMAPKVQAAINFVASGPGRTAVICSLKNAPLAMKGQSGTVIHR
ncbi:MULTISPECIES: carbamate kinase [unclassified Cryobacterium]|uniref:carbamate kinase n=1 Tax=unclassified Cryobacterium TaxID=2649013 RepID=UPI002B23BEFA|nr:MULTISPECIES: carbamate kinase [unclassified Cryobacterium]MEB0004195.1 carbamate kinase [Cryobacterium sp. RTC2.1]MEB0203357.1 carbamate kinase [Cryobacterium sp. 5I3]MEB0267367.1 carbamate kinase [Cryobacterium sp. 10I5]